MERSKTIDKLPLRLYRAEQVRELDRLAIVQEKIAGFELMQRAAKAVFGLLLTTYSEPSKITVFCGIGNNGGDGYVLASLARQRGIAVELIQCGDNSRIKGDALLAFKLAQQEAVPMRRFSADIKVTEGVIVDALLGTGLSGDVRGEPAAAIACINASDCPVLAIDIPSGLCSDSGTVLGESVYAEHTVSFIGLKQGLFTAAGPDYTGVVHFAELEIPRSIFEQVAPSCDRLDLKQLKAQLLPRQATAHKGHFGHVMVTGGDLGMAGATAMASQAACRVGAGLISCATRPEHILAIIGRCPEVMAHGVISGQQLQPLLARATVQVVGPGLGQAAWGEQLLQQVLQQDVPSVLDADALNILAAGRLAKGVRRDNWILTPHPGEAARLLGCSVAEVQQDRFAAVQALQQRYGGAIVLKGAGTLVADGDHPRVGLCAYGNPGMATGGMGDILSGVLGALLAQGLSPALAARLGVCLHSYAADKAAQAGRRGMLATDLIPFLRELVN
jgi:NAD(P)H-hydrate epimerase